MVKNTLRRLNGFIQRFLRFLDGKGYPDADQFLYELKKQFSDEMDDDLNISGALAALFDFVKRVNPPLIKGLLQV